MANDRYDPILYKIVEQDSYPLEVKNITHKSNSIWVSELKEMILTVSIQFSKQKVTRYQIKTRHAQKLLLKFYDHSTQVYQKSHDMMSTESKIDGQVVIGNIDQQVSESQIMFENDMECSRIHLELGRNDDAKKMGIYYVVIYKNKKGPQTKDANRVNNLTENHMMKNSVIGNGSKLSNPYNFMHNKMKDRQTTREREDIELTLNAGGAEPKRPAANHIKKSDAELKKEENLRRRQQAIKNLMEQDIDVQIIDRRQVAPRNNNPSQNKRTAQQKREEQQLNRAIQASIQTQKEWEIKLEERGMLATFDSSPRRDLKTDDDTKSDKTEVLSENDENSQPNLEFRQSGRNTELPNERKLKIIAQLSPAYYQAQLQAENQNGIKQHKKLSQHLEKRVYPASTTFTVGSFKREEKQHLVQLGLRLGMRYVSEVDGQCIVVAAGPTEAKVEVAKRFSNYKVVRKQYLEESFLLGAVLPLDNTYLLSGS